MVTFKNEILAYHYKAEDLSYHRFKVNSDSVSHLQGRETGEASEGAWSHWCYAAIRKHPAQIKGDEISLLVVKYNENTHRAVEWTGWGLRVDVQTGTCREHRAYPCFRARPKTHEYGRWVIRIWKPLSTKDEQDCKNFQPANFTV